MRSLVGIDVRMIDDNLSTGHRGTRLSPAPGDQRLGVFPALQTEVQKSIASDVEGAHEGDFALELGGKLRRNLSWSLLQLASKLESNGQGQLAKLRLARLLHDHGDMDIKVPSQHCFDGIGNLLLYLVKHKL